MTIKTIPLPRVSLYLAGPITGNPDYKEQFEAAAKMMRWSGYDAFNPAKTLPKYTPQTQARHNRKPYILPEPTWHDWMRAALAALGRVDGVALLDGWADSTGARWEERIAREVLALPVLPVTGWIELGGLLP
uniref:DUF4406 domain-containing protein n=1 Tax=Dulem virus 32 TaxID=3145750 RepID=A0AAU8B2G5_9CAUD